jgi:hypothetical protein
VLLPLAQALNLKLPKPLHLLGYVVKGWSKNKQFYIQPIVLWENQSDHQPDHTIFFNSKSKLSDIYHQSGIATSYRQRLPQCLVAFLSESSEVQLLLHR